VPDIEKGLVELRAEAIDLDWFHRIVYGSTERAEQIHHQAFTVDLLLKQMRRYFPDTMIIPWCPYLVAPVAWQTIARGTKAETCDETAPCIGV
jgi:hypothetical protein